MFDVRPVNDAGDLDLDLMNQIKRRKQIDLRLVGRTETQAGPMGISGLRKFVDPRDAEIRRFQKMIYAEKDKQKAIQSRRNSGTMADVSMTQDVSVLPARNGKLADKRLDRSNSHNARLVVDKPVTARNKVEFVRPSVSRPAICRPLLNRPTFDHSVSDIKVADRSRVAFEKPSASRVANPEIAKKRVENIQPSIEKPTITRLAINDPITDIQAINVRVAGNHRPAVNREVKNEAVSPRRISSETKPVRPAIKRTVFNSADIRKDEQFIRVNTVNHSGRIPKKDIIPDPILAKKVFEAGIPLEKVAIRADKSAIEAARRKEQVEKKKARKNYLRKIITAPLGVLKNKIGSKISSLSSGFSQFTDSFKEPTILNREERAFFRKKSFSFFALATSIFVLIFGTSFIYRGISIKNQTLDNSKIAYASLLQAKSGIENKDFTGASMKFSEAYDKFDQINRDIESLGGLIVESSRFIPYLSKLSSGAYLSKSGEDISRIGILITDTMKILNEVKNPLGKDDSTVSYLKIFQETDKNVTETAALVDDLNQNLDKVNVDDIPEEHREQFVSLKQQLPEMNNFISNLSQEEKIFTDVLGGNGPRKYLFLFQNNQEMRATGGFIGTYAVLDIFDGNVKSFFVDGIFNPDGQLKEKVVPPAPIQKISAAWSLHDSNWFPDFPKSAEKASWFYEKTGGPTVDGVITMTPDVMQKLLEITGPIEMKDYGVTIDKDNFLESIQTEVEVDYDKEANQPKKILADLAPKILDQIFNAGKLSDIAKTLNVLLTSLNEKQILIYSKNYNIEKMLSVNGWSGEVLNTKKDYLSVINTNINGYKTDGMIKEKIDHEAEIQKDGSIIDTVTVSRQHNGGGTPYDWWNRVNSDYMRVYVPKGSKLISVSGQTREYDTPPLDYVSLGFKHDPQVEMEESSAQIDQDSGTIVYEDSEKTVFANWVYVSPKESVTIKYTYMLPFKIDLNQTSKSTDTYSLLAQKQSGSPGSDFDSKLSFPDSLDAIWKYPDQGIDSISGTEDARSGYEYKGDLKTDKFIGFALKEKNSN